MLEPAAQTLEEVGGDRVDGAPLSRVRGMLQTVGYDLDDVAALHIAAELFATLSSAHAFRDESGTHKPVAYGALSPTAVLVGWDGSVQIAASAWADRRATARGADGYMAPEQVAGKEILPRSDVYTAALILWELLTRKRAFPRTEMQVDLLRAMAAPRIASLDAQRPDLDARVRALVARALEPRVDRRNVTAKEMASALRALLPRERGLAHLANVMAMVRHEPPAILSVPPQPPQPPTASGERAAPQRSTVDGARVEATGSSSTKLPAIAPRRNSSKKVLAVNTPTGARPIKRAPLPPPRSDTAETVPPPALSADQRDPSSFDLAAKALVVDLPGAEAGPPAPPLDEVTSDEVPIEVTASVVEPPPAPLPPMREAMPSVDVSVSVVAPLPVADAPRRRRRPGVFLVLVLVWLVSLMTLGAGVLLLADRLGYVDVPLPAWVHADR